MPPGRPSLILISQLRTVLNVICWLASSVGQSMVVLASAFTACRRARATYAPLTVPAQLVLLLAWAPTRVLFLALKHAATKTYLADVRLRRRWAELG